MNPPSPFVLVACDSDVARGFTQVILRADGMQTHEVFTPEQALAALRSSEGEARTDAVLLIETTVLGREGPQGDVWGRLVRDHPALPVVCMTLGGHDRAPAALAERVRAHVDPMVPRPLVDAVRGALRARPLSARPAREASREAG